MIIFIVIAVVAGALLLGRSIVEHKAERQEFELNRPRLAECPTLAVRRAEAAAYVAANNLEPCYSTQYRRRQKRAEAAKKKRYAEIAARAKEKADAAREYTQTMREWELDSERIS